MFVYGITKAFECILLIFPNVTWNVTSEKINKMLLQTDRQGILVCYCTCNGNCRKFIGKKCLYKNLTNYKDITIVQIVFTNSVKGSRKNPLFQHFQKALTGKKSSNICLNWWGQFFAPPSFGFKYNTSGHTAKNSIATEQKTARALYSSGHSEYIVYGKAVTSYGYGWC